MNEQINLRLPPKLLKDARQKAKAEGFGTFQAYIEQAVREDVYDDFELTPKEAELIERFKRATDEKKLWRTEKELWNALRTHSAVTPTATKRVRKSR